MKPPHKHFFSSLKQVEKRLKLDDGNPSPPPPPPPPPQPQTTQTQPTESFSGSPIYFYNKHTNASSTFHDNSIEQPPQEFLSYNDIDEFPSNPDKNPRHLKDSENNTKTSVVDDIDSMIRLLRLSDFDGKGPEMPDIGDDEFYDKIVKVKGPRCKKEVERLDGWIKYLSNNSGKEPLRLAHLLLAKAAIVSVGGGDDDGDGIEFPSTVDEFLQNDPPSD